MAASALALMMAGCALVPSTPPEVEVAGVELRGLGLLDQAFGATLCVSNPGDAVMSARRVTAALEVADAPLAEVASDAPVRLPPRSSVLVPLTVATTVRNLGPQLLEAVSTGGVDYRVSGGVQLDGALPITVPFSRRGRLDLLAAGSRLLSLRGQLDLLASGARLLTDTAATASGTRCGRGASS